MTLQEAIYDALKRSKTYMTRPMLFWDLIDQFPDLTKEQLDRNLWLMVRSKKVVKTPKDEFTANDFGEN